ncbi:VirK/YbjX family protein [Massilia sp. X63]|uniref:VirK/YbjX family protein n=1 Tax=Massilia sp. X63 TaxID=3237285 RepID=UPI0034DD196D
MTQFTLKFPALPRRLASSPRVTIQMGISRKQGRLPYMRELVKLKVRSLAHPRATRRWLSLLNSHPAFADYVSHCPRLLYKIYRPYMTLHLPIGERLAALAGHYQTVFAHGLGELVARAARGPVSLVRFAGRDGGDYDIALRAIGLLEREGELVLQLREDGVALYAVAFTFARRDGQLAVNVGCIQGAADEGTRDAIRRATRQLHGLRPKQLLVGIVRALGQALGCREMRLVANANRVVRSAIRNGTVHADYDQLWEELGARRLPDGDYSLPCEALTAPDFEAVASKKRAEARRRHALLASLSAAVAQQLEAARTPVPMAA